MKKYITPDVKVICVDVQAVCSVSVTTADDIDQPVVGWVE